jgi:hypothetical protein
MGTVSKKIADEVIAGAYPEDEIIKIVKYQNSFDGGDSYGLISEGQDLQTYRASEFVINPVTYWELQTGDSEAEAIFLDARAVDSLIGFKK